MKVISKNKYVFHDYQIDKVYEVGIVLKGYEVKSIKSGQINLTDSFGKIVNNELFVYNLDIPLYKKTSINNIGDYNPKRTRKLLINKKEIIKMFGYLNKPGYIIIPLEIFLTNKGLIKLKIGLGKLLKKIQKKQILKEKDQKRQMEREIKNFI